MDLESYFYINFMNTKYEVDLGELEIVSIFDVAALFPRPFKTTLTVFFSSTI